MRGMNKNLTCLMVAALTLLSASGQVEFSGPGVGQYSVIEVTPDGNPNFKIFVLYDTVGVSMSYPSVTGERASICTFDSYPDEIPTLWDGYSTTLSQVSGNTGYIIDDSYYCWVVNYAQYYLSLNDMFCDNDKPCTLLKLRVDGIGHKIPYRTTINGPVQVLDRELELSYNTLEWNDSTDPPSWDSKEVVETFEGLDDVIEVEQPLCNTTFLLTGDRFLRQWNIDEEAVESRYYETQAVDCRTTAVQEKSDGGDDGEGSDDEEEQDGDLGGSAPVRIVFTGYPTDAVVYRVWEIARDVDFEDVILQFNQDEVDYTFSETGTFYVRYMVANSAGSCENYGTTYTVTVSESYVPEQYLIPNIFSPRVRDGVNDVWKVSTKSIVDFHCWIFNRWGNLVYEYTDPDGGWDGTYKGHLVDTGVYYYVLTATGSDGVKYKRRGDISILGETRGSAGTSVDGGGMGTDY